MRPLVKKITQWTLLVPSLIIILFICELGVRVAIAVFYDHIDIYSSNEPIRFFLTAARVFSMFYIVNMLFEDKVMGIWLAALYIGVMVFGADSYIILYQKIIIFKGFTSGLGVVAGIGSWYFYITHVEKKKSLYEKYSKP